MILIVDDKQENLFSLKALLQLHSYEVDTALLGEEALKKTLKNEYVLIILDVQMPGMDGYEVAETITGYSKTKDIPIIFLSAVNVDKRFVTRGYASGGVDYITKPFDPDLLMLKVKTFCRLYEQTRALKQAQENLKEEVERRRKAQQDLETLNGQLEDKVAERTAALVQSNRELEQTNIELQQYASIASHDLQEPLRKITMFSRMLLDKHAAGNPEAAVMAEKVVASTERMRSLINDLLNYSSLSSETPYQHADLGEIMRETLADLEYTIVEKDAVVNMGSLPGADVVPGQMRQLFQNIISNALKFSKQGERPVVDIWGEVIASKACDAVPAPDGEYLRICIRDRGIGFDPSYTARIFNLFQRLHLKTEYEGTGIGLAIAKKIVEKHGGLITANSAEGDGATFIIILPLQQQSVRHTRQALQATS
jgi:signal transduction histidine kinase